VSDVEIIARRLKDEHDRTRPADIGLFRDDEPRRQSGEQPFGGV
jgi:hypothetical protein